MNLLWSDNLGNLTTNYLVNPGSYGGFLIRYSGTAQTGQTVTTTNLGNIILNSGGDDKINVDVDMLQQANNLYGGFIESNSTAGGAFNFSVFIPTGAWFDPKNVYNLTKEMQTYFKCDFPAMTSTLISSGTIQISGILQQGVHSYWHKMFSYNVVSGGASILTNTIAKANIIELYLKNPAALISQMQLIKDNQTFVNGNVANELAYSNYIHEVESSSTFLAVEFAQSKDIRQAISRTLTYNYTFTGAGTLAQYYSAIEFVAGK